MRPESEIFKKNAKTFSFAGSFFDTQTRNRIELMYSFFRWVDDLAEQTDETSRATLQSLTSSVSRDLSPEWNAVRDLFVELEIDGSVIEAFLSCMKSDQRGLRLSCERDLIRYCYGAASTVGLCLTKAFGVKDRQAFAFAIDLGIAMQLTNIIRDIDEDARNDKIYLPELCQKRLENFSDEELRRLKAKYVSLADQYYASARQGFVFLSPRVRFCVSLAATLYRKIGLLALQSKFLRSRAHTSVLHKTSLLAAQVPLFFLSAMTHQRTPSHRTELHRDLKGLPYVYPTL